MEGHGITLDSRRLQHQDQLELAGKIVERQLISDSRFPQLVDLLRISQGIVKTRDLYFNHLLNGVILQAKGKFQRRRNGVNDIYPYFKKTSMSE